MSSVTAIWAFTLAATIATMTPGLDTALVLRTAAVAGKRGGALAALGIAAGVLVWGSATAMGLGVLFRASTLAYEMVRWAGAAYLLYLGARMLVRPRTELPSGPVAALDGTDAPQGSGVDAFLRGFLTNLLNPKVGVFYVMFLPQFIPHNATNPRALMLLFAAIHSAEAVVWYCAMAAATGKLAAVLRRGGVLKMLDRAMGSVFIGFSVHLALERRG